MVSTIQILFFPAKDFWTEERCSSVLESNVLVFLVFSAYWDLKDCIFKIQYLTLLPIGHYQTSFYKSLCTEYFM